MAATSGDATEPCFGYWSPWSARAPRRWRLIAWRTENSMRSTRAPKAGNCRAAKVRSLGSRRPHRRRRSGLHACRLPAQLDLFYLIAGRSRDYFFLFAHQALHLGFPSVSRACAGHRADRRLAGDVAARRSTVGELTVPIYLGLAVVFWLAGFDIIYSLQDREFDRATRLPFDSGALRRRRRIAVVELFSFRARSFFSLLWGWMPKWVCFIGLDLLR